jgi:N-acetylglucosamine kinase-like BadF-type ATPase
VRSVSAEIGFLVMDNIMRYVIGLDGGGSKTECVVAREDGAIVARARGGGVNRNFISEEGFERSVRDAVQGALDLAPEVRRVEHVVGSMGCDGKSMREIAGRYSIDLEHMQWVGEAQPARAASDVAHRRTPHIVTVAGTGSLVAGWGRDGKPRGVGGAGSIVGDEGSAYWIGVRALTRLVESFDGRRPFDEFARQLTQALNLPDNHTLINRVYGGGKRPMTRDEMGAVAPHVSRLANAGDPVACELFRAAAHELAFQTNTVIRMLDMRDEAVLVQLYGGVFRAGAVVIEPLRQEVVAYAPRAELLPPLKCTVIGAAAMALRAIGVDVTAPGVRQQLLEGGQKNDLI